MYRRILSLLALAVFAFYCTPAANAVCYTDAAAGAFQYARTQMDPDEEEQRQLYLLQMAFSAGLQTLDAHQYTDSLTEQDKEILQLLDEKIPAILNKIQKSFAEVEEELLAAGEELARKVIANQNLYPAPTDWETAAGFAAMTGLSYALMSGNVDERVGEVLMDETFGMLMESFETEGYE